MSGAAGAETTHRPEANGPVPGSPQAAVGDGPVELATPVRILAAAASLGAATVHASAVSLHTFNALHAAAFVVMAGAQAAWAYLVLRAATARVLLAGAVVNGSILLLWLVIRTAGLPSWVPGPEGAEQIDTKDLTATVLAVGALVAIDILSRADMRNRLIRASHAGAVVGAGVLLVVILTVAGAFSTGHSHEHHDRAGPHAVPTHEP